MEEKAKRFRRIAANLIMGLAVVALMVFTLVDSAIAATVETEKPLYKGKSETKVSLMINVYWGTEYIDGMLDVFELSGFTTTFFVGGSWAAENDAMLKKIISKGHEIGNHGYFHKDHKKLSRERNREEIDVTHKLIKTMTGIDMTVFAPPSGSFSDTTLEVAKELGYTTVMWTFDTIDWRNKDADVIHKRAVKELAGGNLVLMHPTEGTLKALPKIVDDIKAAGLKVAPVSETLRADEKSPQSNE